MKILCIGEALIDMICTDKGTSLENGNQFLKKTGGAPTNVAAAIAALGGSVDLMAKVGNDPFGDQLINELKSFGVNTEYVSRDEHLFTTIAFVSLMADGERDFVFNRGADANLSIDDINKINVKSYHIIHFGSATAFLPGHLRDAYFHLLERASEAGIFISFDPNYRHLLFKDNIQSFISNSWQFLQNCDFFKMSDEEAILITSENNLDDAIQALRDKTNTTFAITLGKEGTLLRYNDALFNIGSISINSVDTTGAGDAFVGAVLYQLNQTDTPILSLTEGDWKKIITNANIAGARTCEYLGAMEAFKQLNNSIFIS